ncbi:MAG: hypothetical protein ACPGTO_09850, partial [Polaribacter sp.]
MTKPRKRRSFLLDENDTKPSQTQLKLKVSLKSITYRTEQINSTKIEDEIRSHSELKKQYEINLDRSENKASVLLSDLYYEFKPPVMDKVYE